MSKDWLDKLEKGDKVIISGSYTSRVETVDRLTKTQIVLGGTSTKYNRVSGHSIGTGMWDGSFLAEATEERVKKIEQNKIHNKLLLDISGVSWGNLSNETLEMVLDIVNKEIE